jgi:methyl-accepting chemotaxis protein-2 (aspartate sensor receptor)
MVRRSNSDRCLQERPVKNIRFCSQQTIASKLNLILLVTVTAIFVVAGGFLSNWLSNHLEARGIDELQHTNQQVVDMIDAYASALERSADMLGASFATTLPKRFTIDAGQMISTGAATLPALKGSDVVLNNNFALVDQFSVATGGVATLFVRQGDDFYRASTSLRNPKGERVIGTLLGAQHPAHKQIMDGKIYVGRAMLFGRDYMTRYTPIVDDVGKVIGISFIGLDFTESLKALKSRVLGVRVGESGYSFALDAVKEPGLAVIHPAVEGKNIIGIKDKDGIEVARRLIEMRSGVLRYWWQNAENGETQAREKIAVVAPFDRWGWVVSTGAYAEEFSREVVVLRWQLAIVGLIILVVLGLAIFWATNRWISKPLAEAVAVTHRVANGDLTQHIEAKTGDEVGQLLSGLDDMGKHLRQMVSEIDQGIRSLAQDTHRLSQASESVASSSGGQSTAATAMAATVEEMSASIQQVALHAEACRSLAETSGEVSDSGIEVINRAVQGMSSIAQTVGQSSSVVSRLGEESQQISHIVNVIREIADQTNLLALNAAIEAARAGEAGRGFAVVADEVRKLAERTTQSTQEITRMVGSIQQGANHAVESMLTGEHQVQEGVRLASEAGGRINAIKVGADDVSQAVVGISDALREQSVANQEIARNVERIAQQAEDNYIQAKATADTAHGMETLSTQLRASIARFRT